MVTAAAQEDDVGGLDARRLGRPREEIEDLDAPGDRAKATLEAGDLVLAHGIVRVADLQEEKAEVVHGKVAEDGRVRNAEETDRRSLPRPALSIKRPACTFGSVGGVFMIQDTKN